MCHIYTFRLLLKSRFPNSSLQQFSQIMQEGLNESRANRATGKKDLLEIFCPVVFLGRVKPNTTDRVSVLVT